MARAPATAAAASPMATLTRRVWRGISTHHDELEGVVDVARRTSRRHVHRRVLASSVRRTDDSAFGEAAVRLALRHHERAAAHDAVEIDLVLTSGDMRGPDDITAVAGHGAVRVDLREQNTDVLIGETEVRHLLTGDRRRRVP